MTDPKIETVEVYVVGIKRFQFWLRRKRLEECLPMLLGFIGVKVQCKFARLYFDSESHYEAALEILNNYFDLYTIDHPVKMVKVEVDMEEGEPH